MDKHLIAGLVRQALAGYLPPGARLRVAVLGGTVQGGAVTPLHVAVDLPGADAPDGGTILGLARSLRERAARRGQSALPILTLRLTDGAKQKGRRDPK